MAPRNIQERAFEFACRIVRLHEHLIKSGGTARRLANQLLDAGTSIGANLEEASSGQSKRDFVSKCSISLKEARESNYWLRLLVATKLVSSERLRGLLTESDELIAIIATIVKKAKQTEDCSGAEC